MGQLIAAGAQKPGRVTGLSIIKVPYQTPLSTIRRKMEKRQSVKDNIERISEQVKLTKDETHSDSAKPSLTLPLRQFLRPLTTCLTA